MLLDAAPPRAEKRRVTNCRHCGAPLAQSQQTGSGFCCSGCAYVYRLIHEQGLEGYYRIKDGITPPADGAVFEPRSFEWLATVQNAAEADAGSRNPELLLDVQGVSCAGCVWLIEHLFGREAGGREIIVNAQVGSMWISWNPGEFDAAGWARRLQAFGYYVGPAGEAPADLESTHLVRRIGLCAAFALNVMLFALPAYFGMRPDFAYAGLFRLLALLLATFSLLVGGTYFFGRAIRALRSGAMHIDLPIAMGIGGAYLATVYGWMYGSLRMFYPDFVATFILLMLVGRWAQVAAVERNRRSLLQHRGFQDRVRLDSGAEIPRDRLEAGQHFRVGTGETVPVDARLEDSAGAFSTASINGEAEARVYRPGQLVPSGAVSLDRAGARLWALQPWGGSLLARLLAPAQRMGYRHRLVERVVKGYIIGILAGAALTGLGWLLATQDAVRAGAAAIAVLVVSCPCAIGLALPLADEMATVAVRRHGVFVRENDLWSKLGQVRKLIFDKTGTLTFESPVLLNPDALERLAAEERQALVALVQGSHHPIGRSLHEAALASGSGRSLEGDISEDIGFGVSVGPWSLGRAGWRDAGPVGPDTILANSGRTIARFCFSDSTRPGAARDLGMLTKRGYEIYILSGDQEAKVEAFAAEIGVPGSCAVGGLTPSGKAAWIRDNAPADAMMLGDGANDSLAFDSAICRGTPAIHRGVLEQKADFYYLHRGIEGVCALLMTAQRRMRVLRAIIVFSVAYNLAAAGLAAAGLVNPLVAAALMPASSMVSLAIVSIGMRQRGSTD